MKTNCSMCNSTFETFAYKLKRHKNLFCSTVCQYKFTRKKNTLTCRICKNNFDVQKYRVESQNECFCSRKCADKARLVPRLSRACKHCNKTIEFLESRLKHSDIKYCSELCMRNHKKPKDSPVWKQPPVNKQDASFSVTNNTCDLCKKPFNGKLEQKCCSRTCSMEMRFPKNIIACKECSTNFKTRSGVTASEFCSRACFHKHNTKEKIPIICKNCGETAYFPPAVAKHRENCSRKCKYERLSRENSERFNGKPVKDIKDRRQESVYAQIALEKLPNHCVGCQRDDVNFEVHHLDGNRKNNILDNLAIMCLSCHRKLHTFSKKYTLTLQQGMEVIKIVGHLTIAKNSYRSKEIMKEVRAAVQLVKTR